MRIKDVAERGRDHPLSILSANLAAAFGGFDLDGMGIEHETVVPKQ